MDDEDDEYYGGTLVKKVDRKKPSRLGMLTIRDVRARKRKLENNLNKAIDKQGRSKINDHTVREPIRRRRIRGAGMSEERLMDKIMPMVSGHGLVGDNHKVAQIITRSLHAYPRLKHLYTHGLTHGRAQPAIKPAQSSSVPAQTTSVLSV